MRRNRLYHTTDEKVNIIRKQSAGGSSDFRSMWPIKAPM